jgi:hypothetical protein
MQLSAISMEIHGFAWKSMVSHAAFRSFIGNQWIRMQLFAISLEIYGFANSFIQFHWESKCSPQAFSTFTGHLKCSLTAFYNSIGKRSFRIELSAIPLESLIVAWSFLQFH